MLPEQLQRIIGYFLEEAKENLHTIEQGLLHLQNTMEMSDQAHRLIRATHSIKGGAAMLGFTSIQRVAHSLEECFKTLRECPIPVDSKLESLLRQLVDTLITLMQKVSPQLGLNQEAAAALLAPMEPVFDSLNRHIRELIPIRLTIRASTDEYVHILSGYCTSLTSFYPAIGQGVSLLGGRITRHEQDPQTQNLSMDIQLLPSTSLERVRNTIQTAGGVIGTVQTQRSFSLFTGTEYPLYALTIERPKACVGCCYYYGRNDGGNFLNCAVHPNGPESDKCRDWEKYT